MIKKILKNIITFGLIGVVTAGILSGGGLKAYRLAGDYKSLQSDVANAPQYIDQYGDIMNGNTSTLWIYNNFITKYGQETADAYKQSLITGDYSYIYNALGSTSPIYDMADVCITDSGTSLLNDDWPYPNYTVEVAIQIVYARTGVLLNLSELTQLADNKGYTSSGYKYGLATFLNIGCTYTAADCKAVKVITTTTTTTDSQTSYNLSDYADEFDATYYYNRYPDLQKTIGNDTQALLEHWINYGKAEGRIAKAQ